MGFLLNLASQQSPVPQPLLLPPPLLTDLDKIGMLGIGSEDRVYKVRHRGMGMDYALKLIHAKDDPMVLRQIQREISILRTSKLQHVVECYGVYDRGGEVSFVLENMDGGHVGGCAPDHKELGEPCLADVTKQVLRGLVYLHKHRIMHRGIKPSNLLLNRKEVKIADFEASTVLKKLQLPLCQLFIGACAYMSPERFDLDGNGREYGYAPDIWSLGLTLLEYAIRRFPCLHLERSRHCSLPSK